MIKLFRISIITALILALQACSSSVSSQCKQEVDATNLAQCITLAEQGDPVIQYNVGRYYYNDSNYPKALTWLQKAAEQGEARAQTLLGWMYAQGKGLSQNIEQAVVWFQKSADNGDSGGQNNLAYHYEKGLGGLKQDYEQAIFWYQKSAMQRDRRAEYHLGVMYRDGKGVVQDIEQAKMWFEKASNQNDKDAAEALLVILEAELEQLTLGEFEGRKPLQQRQFEQKSMEIGRAYEQATSPRKEEAAWEAVIQYKKSIEEMRIPIHNWFCQANNHRTKWVDRRDESHASSIDLIYCNFREYNSIFSKIQLNIPWAVIPRGSELYNGDFIVFSGQLGGIGSLGSEDFDFHVYVDEVQFIANE